MAFAFLCDFDGTVSPTDVGEAFVRRFSTDDPAARDALLRRWLDDEIGHRALTERFCERFAVTADEAMAFVRGYAVDPAFPAFAREAEARGDRVVVVSEGFDFYIHDLLGRAGLGAVAVAANRARFEHDGLVPEFPYAGRGCGRCGNCKAVHAEAQRAAGYEVVFVGDGLSDRCGARAADRVIARGALLEWCRAQGIPALGFDRFGDVAAHARALAADAPSRRAAAGGEA